MASLRGVAGPTCCVIEDRIPDPPDMMPLLPVPQRKDGPLFRPAFKSCEIVSVAADLDAPASRVRLRASRVPRPACLGGIASTHTYPKLP